MAYGTLYGVSVGPGDPELLTLKAVRVLREADCIAIPGKGRSRRTARQIVSAYLDGKQIIECATPMTRDRAVVRAAYARIADTVCAALREGKTVAYAVLGDATVYSTFAYIQDLVSQRGFETRIVPGVTSFCAAAAKLGRALCEGDEQLLVVPAGGGDIGAALDYPAVKAIMKSGRSLPAVREQLRERGLLESSAAIMNCGLDDEAVFTDLTRMPDRDDYFCVVITKDDCG